MARGASYSLALADGGATLTLQNHEDEPSVVRMQLAGAAEDPQSSGLDLLPGQANFFLGNDPDAQDDNSHGSHTMGTAAAVGKLVAERAKAAGITPVLVDLHGLYRSVDVRRISSSRLRSQ